MLKAKRDCIVLTISIFREFIHIIMRKIVESEQQELLA